MKEDYAINSHYLTNTFIFKRLGECIFWSWELRVNEHQKPQCNFVEPSTDAALHEILDVSLARPWGDFPDPPTQSHTSLQRRNPSHTQSKEPDRHTPAIALFYWWTLLQPFIMFPSQTRLYWRVVHWVVAPNGTAWLYQQLFWRWCCI